MNIKVLSRVCCPACKDDLALHSFIDERIMVAEVNSKNAIQEGGHGEDRVIQEGVLVCLRCKVWYPIHRYVPILLVFQTPVHLHFAAQYAKELRPFSEYRMPHGTPNPGELSIQETFTDEWETVEGDELSFLYTLEDLKALNREVWLKWIPSTRGEIRNVLNVGVGLGSETAALQEVIPEAEVIGIDLNFGLLCSAATYKARPTMHLVVASLFAIPFRTGSFDLVYSQGVIHHTFSTRKAFEAIASYVRDRGYVFIWVYGLDDHLVRRGLVGAVRRAQWHFESIVRPLVSAAPRALRNVFFSVSTLALHPVLRRRVRNRSQWRPRNTNHALRDWLSPRYAARHSYNEVLEWYEDLGFEIVDMQSPGAYRRLFGRRLWGVGVTGRRKGNSCPGSQKY